MTLRYLEEEICLDRGWDFRKDWSRKSKRERAQIMAFYRVKGAVTEFGAHEEMFRKAGMDVDLEDWRSWDEATKQMKVDFAAKTIRGK